MKYLFVVIMIITTLTSCSDKQDLDSDKSYELAQWIKSCVLDDNGEIIFFKNDASDGLYALPVVSAEDATWFVEDLTHTKWDGNPTIVSTGHCGLVRIASSEKDGVYKTLIFNMKGLPAFTLEITTWEYINSNNSYGPKISIPFHNHYLCAKCLKISSPSTDGCCRYCGFSYEGLKDELSNTQFGDLYCMTPETKLGYVVSFEEASEKDIQRCIGMVFYVGQHVNDKSDYSGTGIGQQKCHGYAVAMKYLNDGRVAWGPNNNRLHLWPDYPKEEENESNNVYITRDWNGYLYTTKIIEKVGGKNNLSKKSSDYPATYLAVRRESPSNSSGWFLPAMGQMREAFWSYEAITDRGGDDYIPAIGYWTSNINTNDFASSHFVGDQRVYYLFYPTNTDHGFMFRSNVPDPDWFGYCDVRPVIAF